MRRRPLPPPSSLMLVLLLCACLPWLGCSAKPDDEAEGSATAQVRTASVTEETITPRAKAVGTLDPLLGHAADVVPIMPGRVLSIEVREGDRVAKGELLIKMETTSRARAEHTQAKLALSAAELQAGRAKRLYEAGVWSKSTWEEADRALAGAKSEERAAAVDARREEESAELRAPLAGVVTSLNTVVGALADGSVPLMRVVDASELLAKLQLPVKDVGGIALGAKLSLTVPALQGLAPVESTVWKKALPLETGSQYAQVQAKVDNAKGLLAPGMSVEAEVALPERRALVVPSSAVVTKNALTAVFKIEGDKAVQIAVTVSELDPGKSEIVGEGIKAGDLVATEGAYELSDGMAVKGLSADRP